MNLQHEDKHSAIGPKNNLHLDDVARAVQSNNAIDYSERVRSTLNDAVRNTQTLNLEEKLLEFNNHFNVASDAIRARMLQEIDRVMHMLIREEQNTARIQDPPVRRRRTYGKGGPRRQTAAEIVENQLKRNDREIPRQEQQYTESETPIIDLTSSSSADSRQDSGSSKISIASQQGSRPFTVHRASQHPATPIIMTFSASGTVIRSPQRREGSTYPTLSSSIVQEPDVTVLESWTVEEAPALPNVPNIRSNAPSNQPAQAASSRIGYLSSNLITRSQRQCKRSIHYQAELGQSFKRVRKENRE